MGGRLSFPCYLSFHILENQTRCGFGGVDNSGNARSRMSTRTDEIEPPDTSISVMNPKISALQ
jgi:hypothetical protein